MRKRGEITRIALLCAGVGVFAGCPHDVEPERPRRTQRVRVRSFTEASPIRHLVAASSSRVFSASDHGMDRWNLRTGEVLHLTAEHGLPGDRVQAMTYDGGRDWLWLVTDAGVARHQPEAGTFSEIPSPPAVLGLESLEGVVLEPAADGGLWLGHEAGLFYTNTAGQWTNTGVTDPVTALHRARDGWLWIGTEVGLIGRQPDGESFRFGAGDGCDLERVRFIARAPDGGPVIVGSNADGDQRVVLVVGGSCASYRVAPERRWEAAVPGVDGLVVLAGERLFSLRMPTSGARRLRRDGMRLVRIGGDHRPPRSPYVIRTLDLRLPPDPEAIVAAADEVLVGTRDLGIARLIAGRRRGRTRWLRRSELVRDATALSAACPERDDCYVGTGAEAWRFRGDAFVPVESEHDILAFARSPTGVVYAIHRTEDGAALAVSTVSDGVLEPVSGITVQTPGSAPAIAFSRFSPAGVLWLGLRYRDDDDELRPYGVALVDVSLGAVVYHRASADIEEVREGVLPIPINVIDVSFMGETEIWLASTEGAAQIRGREVDVYNEAEGLRSEVLRAVAASSGGIVFAGSAIGVDVFDGEAWDHPRILRYPVNDLEIGDDGALWMATERGLVVYDGSAVRRLDRRRGLIQNQVEDISIDRFGRVWVRGSEGLTLVTP